MTNQSCGHRSGRINWVALFVKYAWKNLKITATWQPMRRSEEISLASLGAWQCITAMRLIETASSWPWQQQVATETGRHHWADSDADGLRQSQWGGNGTQSDWSRWNHRIKQRANGLNERRGHWTVADYIFTVRKIPNAAIRAPWGRCAIRGTVSNMELLTNEVLKFAFVLHSFTNTVGHTNIGYCWSLSSIVDFSTFGNNFEHS